MNDIFSIEVLNEKHLPGSIWMLKNIRSVGTPVNSPTIYRWEPNRIKNEVPQGTKECTFVPCGTLDIFRPIPNDKSLGY